ncbi:MAG: transporter substrate-binding domain-containing protein [Acetobacteraceae bacterium]|nr:transporter substrate-binding domain-containing protein [Acetobacteraceae bacterium]
MRRRALLAATAALLGSVAPARAQTVADIKAKGKLVAGVMVDVPPFALLDENNQPTGYDADVARELAKRMGVPLEMVVVTGPNRIPYLLTGKVDMLIAVLGIVPERTKVVLFSEPYAGFSNFIYARKELNIHSLADLKGLTVAVPRANTSDILLTKQAPRGTNILRFDDDAAVRAALLAGQVDATSLSITNLPAVEKVVGKDKFERKFDLLTQVQGIAVRPGATELIAWINAQIEDMKKNGQLEAVNQKWTGLPLPDLSIPKP